MAGSDHEYARIPCGQGTDIVGITTEAEADNPGRVILGGRPFDPAEARNLVAGLILAINIAEDCSARLQGR